MKKILLSAILFSSIIACREESLSNRDAQLQAQQNLLDVKSVYKQEFSIALAKALAVNADLRDFIKKEALKEFDNDYDVLYQMVKDQLIGGKTFKNIIAEQYTKKENLEALERLYPTLTIFVPELPMDSFSAEKWDVKTEIPLVAYTLNTTKDIPIVTENGSEFLLEAKYIPSFPIVVVKENERVKVVSLGDSVKNKTMASIDTKSSIIHQDNLLKGSSYNFEFLDDAFNGNKSNGIQKSASVRTMTTRNDLVVDPKIQQAYEIYKNTDGWQRDYIYYNIAPSNTRGKFSYDFMEYITSFTLNKASDYSKIADQDDPKLNTDHIELNSGNIPDSSGFWTEGNFEFSIIALVNGKNGVGSIIEKGFTLRPSQLFNLFYEKTLIPLPPPFPPSMRTYMWKVKEATPIEVALNIPLLNWSLEDYSSSIKISIEEVDPSQTTTDKIVHQSKFAANFSIDPTEGLMNKIGLKFGASAEVANSTEYTVVTNLGNDKLRDVIVNFGDNTIIGLNNSQYIRRKYDSGFFTITVEPKRVQ
ncbi:hypothetical protein ATE49_17660 [Elizabethkingia miricola]|uniref:Uncharacterized protein n=1 Tax=Elizabethkingia miricola TaxID=172045 RepID=A0ABY3NIT6_ELIMR|nr:MULTISPECIES: hypothetical protein [Elizabethkingia]OBS14494.1 hypothetical protein ATE49_17660 [Elizabethkingia miricola]TYO92609.1 hypothetical protein LX74_01571 [Elizabethkingia miricola]